MKRLGRLVGALVIPVTLSTAIPAHAGDPVASSGAGYPAVSSRNSDFLRSREAGSVEDGLEILAEEIVAKSRAADKGTIAVLPFPNADGSCSVLSTYLADELIQALFSVPNASLQIVERNQLEAIVNEIHIGQGGLLNPETTQKLGNVSGVKALTIGTITQIGDRIRINARLVATDTGRTISAAAVTIPRTSDVESLLRQPVSGGNGTCGVHMADTSASQPVGSGFASPGGGTPGRPASPAATLEGIAFTPQSVARSADKKSVAIVLSLVNKSSKDIELMLVQPKPVVVDDAANTAEAEIVNGIQICMNFNSDAMFCKMNFRQQNATTLSPNLPTDLLMRFTLKEGEFTGGTISVVASLLKGSPDKDSAYTVKGISLSLANLPIKQPSSVNAMNR